MKKADPDGSLDKYKSRVVAKGFRKRFGDGYKDTFSPVVCHSTIHLVLVIMVVWHIKRLQLDIKTTFLNTAQEQRFTWNQRKDSRTRVLYRFTVLLYTCLKSTFVECAVLARLHPPTTLVFALRAVSRSCTVVTFTQYLRVYALPTFSLTYPPPSVALKLNLDVAYSKERRTVGEDPSDEPCVTSAASEVADGVAETQCATVAPCGGTRGGYNAAMARQD